jgi:hypothetical protein
MEVNAYTLHTGTYVPYFNKVQTNNSGDTKKFELNPYIGIGDQLKLSGPHFFMPELGYTYFTETAKNTEKDIIHLNYNFLYILTKSFALRYGLSNNWYRLKGQGGSVRLSNGTGSTNFPSPDKTVTTYYTTLNIGGEYIFGNRKFGLRFDYQTMSFQELENRAFNYLLTINFYR